MSAERHAAEIDAPTVCIAHGAFIPCRKDGEHRYTSNPYWVKSVRDYQFSAPLDLTWEPAWERVISPGECSVFGQRLAAGARCSDTQCPQHGRAS